MTASLERLVINTFVNQIKIMAPKQSQMIERVKSKLILTFLIVKMGLVSFYYLGLKVKYDEENQKIKLS